MPRRVDDASIEQLVGYRDGFGHQPPGIASKIEDHAGEQATAAEARHKFDPSNVAAFLAGLQSNVGNSIVEELALDAGDVDDRSRQRHVDRLWQSGAAQRQPNLGASSAAHAANDGFCPYARDGRRIDRDDAVARENMGSLSGGSRHGCDDGHAVVTKIDLDAKPGELAL